MRKHKVGIIFFLSLFICQQVHSQGTFDEVLIQEEYDHLADLFSKHLDAISKAKPYAKALLLKAKQENSVLKIADGYYKLAIISDADQGILFTDSIITILKDKKDFDYPAKAHILKANFLGSQTNYQEAMSELAKANSYANSNGNIEQQYQIKYFIAILKSNLGEYEDSLEILKDLVSYYENKYTQNAVAGYESRLFTRNKSYESGYITSLYAYGIHLNDFGNYKEAEKINKKAILLSLKSKDSLLYDRLLFSSGIIQYHKKQYQSSLDSILKSRKINATKRFGLGTAIATDFYLGKIYLEQGKKELAVKLLKKVDSVAFAKNYFFPGIRSNYELLIQYYKERKNTEQQLFYINRLLAVDSILDSDVKYLSKEINEAYTAPNLVLEKEKLIESLENKNNTKQIWLAVLSVFSLLLIVFLVRNQKKQKTYKKRFLELLKDTKQPEKTTKGNNNHSLIAKKPEDIGVPESIVKDILENLEKFEQEKGFLEGDISLAGLSKKFSTNSKYFSKVVNTYKNKSFTTYINELRIYHSIEELKQNSKFRKYTIKAIAKEMGFNTTEAFSKSFYKTTGIYPSFFIKQFKKNSLKNIIDENTKSIQK